MNSHKNLGKKCQKCGINLLNWNKSGFCNHHRDRTGKNNPFYGKRHKRETIEKAKKKLSEISKLLWKNSEYRNKVISRTPKPRIPGFKKEQSERIKKWYKDNPNQLRIRSDVMKQAWIDGKIEPNINSINESKLEINFREELKKIFFNHNVRKSTIRIGKKWFYPDVKINKDFLIEFYGNYWHANPHIYKPDDIVHHGLTASKIWHNNITREEILKNNGFRVFSVWQDEWKNDKKNIIRIIKSNI